MEQKSLIAEDIRPPSTGNFCLGVSQKVGERQYKLNHFAIAWTGDPTATRASEPPISSSRSLWHTMAKASPAPSPSSSTMKTSM